MPDFTLTMSRHYIPETAGDFEMRLALAQDEHYTNHGTVPTLCHIPATITSFPALVGKMRIIRAKPGELGPHEIDLGVEQAEVTR